MGAALLAAALCLFAIFKNTKRDGGTVEVTQDGKLVGVYPLSENAVYEFSAFYGHNTLVIENGFAYMSESTCHDHICEGMGRISKVGETIICLPNELFVKVTDGEEGDYDAVVR
ncbi:MAG: NusG domain II-containing protein [Butyrivibrio sp.]|nr:NusG domain II-containing protein [Butyrivibrio sp.]